MAIRTSFQDVHRAAPAIVKWIRGGSNGLPVQIVFYTWPSDDEADAVAAHQHHRAGRAGGVQRLLSGEAGFAISRPGPGEFFRLQLRSPRGRLDAAFARGRRHSRLQLSLPMPSRRDLTGRCSMAAAMDRNWLNPGQRYGQALWVTEWLLNMRNQADFALNLYPIRTFYGKQALGRVGFSPRDRFLMGPLAARITEWDVTWAIRTEHAWVFYYHNREIGNVIAPVLAFAAGQPLPAPARATRDQTVSCSSPREQQTQHPPDCRSAG